MSKKPDPKNNPASSKVSIVKLNVKAGKANPAPPIGTALGPRGINIMEFCKQFNAASSQYEPDSPLKVKLEIKPDKTFSFKITGYQTSYLIKKAAKITSGSKASGREAPIASITSSQLDEIATQMLSNSNSYTLEGAKNMVRGTARSMGVKIV